MVSEIHSVLEMSKEMGINALLIAFVIAVTRLLGLGLFLLFLYKIFAPLKKDL